MNISEIALKHFPYEKPNVGQLEAIVELVEHVLAGNKHIILESPVGTGKSVIAKVVYDVVNEIRGCGSTIITSTKGLQDQYIVDFPDIMNIKGKNNYGCPKDCGPYRSDKCLKKLWSNNCVPKKECPYVRTRNTWTEWEDLRITNNSFFIKSPGVIKGVTDILFVDEAHDIDEKLIDAAAYFTTVVELKELAKLDMELPKLLIKQMIEIGRHVGQAFRMNEDQMKRFNEIVNRFADLDDVLEDDKTPQSIREIAIEVRSKCELVIQCGIKTEWILTKYAPGEFIEFKPVYAASVADWCLFRWGKQIIYMSATICGVDEFAKSLNIKDYVYVNVDHPIDVERRRVLAIDNYAVGRNFNDWTSYYNTINTLMSEHQNENGIIHTVSYNLANDIFESLAPDQKKRCLVSGDIKDIMAWMDNPGAVVISPSIEKGVDFKNDLARWQIIAKTPFSYLGDPHVKLNTNRNSRWYARKAILRLVQASGRVVRGVDDWGMTYILDSNSIRLVKQNQDIVPSWFLESFEVVRT